MPIPSAGRPRPIAPPAAMARSSVAAVRVAIQGSVASTVPARRAGAPSTAPRSPSTRRIRTIPARNAIPIAIRSVGRRSTKGPSATRAARNAAKAANANSVAASSRAKSSRTARPTRSSNARSATWGSSPAGGHPAPKPAPAATAHRSAAMALCCPIGNCCNLDDICEPCCCEIEGVRVEAQAFAPDNRCLFCDPASSTTAWTFGPDYSVCSDPTAVDQPLLLPGRLLRRA